MLQMTNVKLKFINNFCLQEILGGGGGGGWEEKKQQLKKKKNYK